jgi:hypothetical protein
MNMIYVFKTDVSSVHRAGLLKPELDRLFPHCKWNFDLEDCDNIFRVDSKVYTSDTISAGLHKLGIVHEELL